jgi:hypothetical protein
VRSTPPTIVLRTPDGRVICEWTPDPPLWIDLQAFAAATDRSIPEIIRWALTEFLIGR